MNRRWRILLPVFLYVEKAVVSAYFLGLRDFD
jgi:hypothetical protein